MEVIQKTLFISNSNTMKKFILNIISFTFLLFAVALSVDYIISSGLRQMEDYRFQTYDALLKGGMEHDLIIVGNSRGFSHFNPIIIDSVCNISSFNISRGGYPFNVQKFHWDLYKSNNKKPKYIVHNVDFVTLNTMTMKNQHQSEANLPYFYNPFYNKTMKGMGYNWLDRYIPLYRYFGYQMAIKNGLMEFLGVKHYNHQPSNKGFRYEYGTTWDGGNLNEMKTITAAMDSTTMKNFEHYMEDCYNDSIKVILVNSPVYHVATERCENMNELNTYFDSIARKYNTHYLNYIENYHLCNDTANFSVSVHMTPTATDIFSRDFSDTLKTLINK